MERVIIHCHCKVALENVMAELREIKEILTKKETDKSVIEVKAEASKASTASEPTSEEVVDLDMEINKVFNTPDVKAKLQSLVERAFKPERDDWSEQSPSGPSPPSLPKNAKYDWSMNQKGALFIQQYVQDNQGSKSNRVRDQTYKLGLELGLWGEGDKKAVNYKIEQVSRQFKKKSEQSEQREDESS